MLGKPTAAAAKADSALGGAVWDQLVAEADAMARHALAVGTTAFPPGLLQAVDKATSSKDPTALVARTINWRGWSRPPSRAPFAYFRRKRRTVVSAATSDLFNSFAT